MTVAGRVDSSNANELDTLLAQLIEDKHFKLVLELTEVVYMSSAGLRGIVSALRSAKKKQVVMCVLQPRLNGSPKCFRWRVSRLCFKCLMM